MTINWGKGWKKWVVWLVFLVVSFAILEGMSIHDDTSTLSRFVWNLTAAFPPIMYIAGFLAGFLCCHFWWMGSPVVDAGQKALDAAKVVAGVLMLLLVPASALTFLPIPAMAGDAAPTDPGTPGGTIYRSLGDTVALCISWNGNGQCQDYAFAVVDESHPIQNLTVCNTLECGGPAAFHKFAQTVFGEATGPAMSTPAPKPEPMIVLGDPNAKPPSGSLISIGDIFGVFSPYINALLNALIPLFVGYVCYVIKQKTGIDIDQAHQATFDRALENQAGALVAKGAVNLNGHGLDVHYPSLAKAANDLIASIPQAAKHFGLTPDFVASRIVARIAQLSDELTKDAVTKPTTIADAPPPPPTA